MRDGRAGVAATIEKQKYIVFRELDQMDVRIGLLVQNRISVQEVGLDDLFHFLNASL